MEKECTKEHRYQIPTNIRAAEEGWAQVRGYCTEAEATWLCQVRCWWNMGVLMALWVGMGTGLVAWGWTSCSAV